MKNLVMINFCDGLYGGIESFLVNAFYKMSKEEFSVTFLTCGRTTYNMVRNPIESNGGLIEEINILPSDLKNKIKLYFALKYYFSRRKPDIVHINSGTISLHLIASIAARGEGIKSIIVHSHNYSEENSFFKKMIRYILKIFIEKSATNYLACSNGAAVWMFRDSLIKNGKVVIIPNGIDALYFKYSEKKRLLFRKKLGLKDELIIGNIGRFQGQKNHKFMIKIIKKLIKYERNAKLLLVGNGELKNEIRELVKFNKLDDNVMFLGERNDMDAFLSAIDAFVFPSLYEGFGIAAVEAQASGALVLLSNHCPTETNVSGRAVYLPIDNDNDEELWVKEILKQEYKVDRLEENNIILRSDYSIRKSYEKLFDVYRGVL